jgi:hypothetical protein
MDYRKFGMQVESLIEMYLNGDFDVYNSELSSYENAEKALIKSLIDKLNQNQEVKK